jgi:hypothetical protein
MLLSTFGTMSGAAARAESEGQAQRQPDAAGIRVIQGRITGINGDVVTVKTPDGYPGGPGMHAQFVTAGPAFDIDVSHSRVLLPDGRQADRHPLVAGDRILVVLSEPAAASATPSAAASHGQTYQAMIIERVATSDRVISH